MNRTIKFRGKGLLDEKYIYGVGYADGIIFSPVGRETLRFRVDPNSVAQLVGYDADGNEVYEGDKLIDIFGEEYTAAIYDLPQVTQTSKLKEVQA